MKPLYLVLAVLSPLFLTAQSDVYRELQTRLQTAEDGEIISLPEGTFRLQRQLWLDDKRGITIRGAGADKTILDFSGQADGAEGLKVTRCQAVTLEDFHIINTSGDAIKVQETQGITIRRVATGWTGKPGPKNGGYGLYPVQCSNVLIEFCEAYGASDAGIYVGQSEDIVVRHCHAHHNVAGIEIENSHRAEVHDNLVEKNTGGILVFDLPGLPVPSGSGTRVYGNVIRDNNHRNFAPRGNIVAQVPAGSGVVILATEDCEVRDNTISGHRTVGTAIISYYVTELPILDTAYVPYPRNIRVHDNRYSRDGPRWPSTRQRLGKLLAWKFRRHPPDIIHDGILNEAWLSGDGNLVPPYRICIGDNGNFRFASLDAANGFKGLHNRLEPYRCDEPAETTD
jgi:parallel beta-helix repeat protein